MSIYARISQLEKEVNQLVKENALLNRENKILLAIVKRYDKGRV